jgi:hypothetical protein
LSDLIVQSITNCFEERTRELGPSITVDGLRVSIATKDLLFQELDCFYGRSGPDGKSLDPSGEHISNCKDILVPILGRMQGPNKVDGELLEWVPLNV